MTGRLEGEVAIVTGSTAGLGREIARLMASEGASVVVTGRHRERGEAVAASIDGSAFIAADLTVERECDALVDAAAERFGPVTVLVNNAVIGDGVHDGPVTDVTAADFEAVLRLDLVAAATMCRLVIPDMLAAGHGAIVNVSSRAAERASPGLAAYAAAKAGLNGLSRSITMDFARQGVRCNTVQPGYILHERRDAGSTPDRMARLEAQHLTRLTTATDVAYAVVFLASRQAETISGVTLPVDGGSSAVRALTLG
ncbi:MAG: short-chain dehydrogenase [Acidimicrobiales bacterium]|nr:short-chain dehydrogenase [Acidimicrobiales bacterium]